MSDPHRLIGLPNGAINPGTREIRFDLAVEKGRPISFIAKYGAVAQVIAGLARMAAQIRDILHAQGGIENISPEKVVECRVQKDRWSDVVLLEILTDHGIPYSLVVPRQTAIGIADRLKIESAKATEIGMA